MALYKAWDRAYTAAPHRLQFVVQRLEVVHELGREHVATVGVRGDDQADSRLVVGGCVQNGIRKPKSLERYVLSNT